MYALFENIRSAVGDDRFVVTNHADERLRERAIEIWQLLGSLDESELLASRPDDLPNPSVVVRQSLPDGTSVQSVWAWVESARLALLVTVYFEHAR